MKKIMKDNKYTMIGLIAFILLVILGLGAYKFLFPNIGSPIYGNRLAEIEKSEITTNNAKEIIKTLKEEEIVISATYDIKGKIFNLIITVKDDTKLDDAKKLTEQILTGLSEKQLEYYDLQVFFKTEKENIEGYPTIGYKGKTEEKFYYTSATAKVEEKDEE